MSAAIAATDAEPAVPAKTGAKKKLIVIVAAVLALLLVGGGGAAFFVIKKRAAAAAAAEEGGEAAEEKSADAARPDAKSAPTFVPLDPFTVNLADREAERFVQVGMTLELTDPKAGELLKAYMPAIRNNILLLLASKNAAQLMDHDGKLLLAAEVRATSLQPLGFKMRVPALSASGVVGKLTPTADEEDAPIRAVHFSAFIIQ